MWRNLIMRKLLAALVIGSHSCMPSTARHPPLPPALLTVMVGLNCVQLWQPRARAPQALNERLKHDVVGLKTCALRIMVCLHQQQQQVRWRPMRQQW